MRLIVSLIAVAFFSAISMSGAQQPDELKILHTYRATIDNAMKPKMEKNFVANAKEWSRIYRAFFPDGKIQPVDFAKHFVLVSTQDAADPNRRRVTIGKDAKGAVSVQIASTLIGFRPSGKTMYTFYVVPRAGVTGVKRYDRAKKALVVDSFPK